MKSKDTTPTHLPVIPNWKVNMRRMYAKVAAREYAKQYTKQDWLFKSLSYDIGAIVADNRQDAADWANRLWTGTLKYLQAYNVRSCRNSAPARMQDLPNLDMNPYLQEKFPAQTASIQCVDKLNFTLLSIMESTDAGKKDEMAYTAFVQIKHLFQIWEWNQIQIKMSKPKQYDIEIKFI